MRSSERTDVSHLDHGSDKIRVKGGRLSGIAANDGVGGSTIEELLVGVEEPLLVNKIVEVVVVERCGRLQIKWCEVVVP